MAGFSNDTMYAANVNFAGGKAATVLADGQLLIGATVAPNIRVGTLTSSGGSVTITNGAGTINLETTGGAGITNFNVDANTAPGTDPVVPNGSGTIAITGAQVAAGVVGANVIRTDSLAANAFTIEVQRSTAVASTASVNNGVAHFNSAQFSVDGNGFVSTSGTGIGNTITGDTGGALSPTAGNWNILGSGSITTSGAASTLTTQLTGLTNHAVLVGAGTSTITKVGPTATAGQVFQSAGSSADPVFSTATYPSTTTVSQILYSSATNTVSGLATSNRGVLTTGATGVPAITALATDGQLIIGSTAGAPAAATLTAGTGVSITNGSNSITVNAVGGGITWSVVTVDTTFTVNTGTIANRAGTLAMALPAISAVGSIIEITGINTAAGWQITQAASQQIFFGNTSTTLGATGSLTSTAIRDSLKMVCVVANLTWNVLSSIGNITVV